jgi:nucleoside-diphosphate-sugar epimerase
MNILLIGGAGFIGKHLERDLEKDNNVVVIDKKFGTNVNSKEDLELISPDYDCVVFLAAEPNLAAVKRNPVEATHTLTTGLINCLERFKNSHFVYFSSSMVYGNWDGHSTKMEYDHPAPIDLYGRLKLVGEGLVKELHDNWTIVRPTAVYGPGDDPKRVLPTFIRIARTGGEIEVKGVDNCLDFTHVSDIVQAFRLIIEKHDSLSYNKHIFNVSYGQSHSLDTVAAYICELVGSGSYKIVDRDYDYPKRGALSISKITSDLGYLPKVNVQVGIKKLLEEL